MSGGPSAVNGTTTGEWLLQWDVIRIIHRQGQCETAPQRVEDRWLPPGIQRSLHRLQDHYEDRRGFI